MKLAANLMLLFPVGSTQYFQFSSMLAQYTLAYNNANNITMNPVEQPLIGRPV